MPKPNLILNEKFAFPTATGFGRYAGTSSPARSLYVVSSLADSGANTLRDALSASNRDIVFSVSGDIELESTITINASNVRILGQTAPGDGIAVVSSPSSPPSSVLMTFNGGNSVARHFRVRRLGEEVGSSSGGFGALSGTNYIHDHLSYSWTSDDLLGGMYNGGGNWTVQNCLIYNGVPKSGQAANQSKGALFYNLSGGMTVSNNILAHVAQRNPSTSTFGATLKYEMINNLIYNRGSFGANIYTRDDANGGEVSGTASDGVIQANIIGNLFIAGSNTITSRYDITTEAATGSSVQLYVEDNITNQRPNSSFPNWDAIGDAASIGSPASSATFQANSRYDFASSLTNIKTTSELEAYLKPKVGANLSRDTADQTVITQVSGRSGSLLDLADIPSLAYPTLTGTAETDSNSNGIADSFESIHGLSGDGTSVTTNWDFGNFTITNNAGYTDREMYWAWLANDFDTLLEGVTMGSGNSGEVLLMFL